MEFDPTEPYESLPEIPPPDPLIHTIPIWKQESRARAALAHLKGLANIIPNQTILINAITLREAKDSSAIENIVTTQDSLYRAVSSNIVSLDPATKEVLNYREAVNTGLRIINKRGLLRINDIVEIQQIIVGNNAGYRKLPGTVLMNEGSAEIVYTPPQHPEKILDLMANFVSYFNQAENDLINCAVLHYQFESIHPFYDGNGRTGRILNVLYMILKEQLDIPILYLSSFMIRHRQEYYSLLQQVLRENDWESWILFFLRGIETTAIETIGKIDQIKTLLDAMIIKIRSELPRIYSKELVELLFENPYSKIEFLVKKIGVERKAAARYLNMLEQIGILKSQKVGREKFFKNVGLIDILST